MAEVHLLNAIVFFRQKDSQSHRKLGFPCRNKDPTKYFVMVGDTDKEKPRKA